MKKVFVVYNPVAGHKKGKNLAKRIQKKLESLGCKYEWYETQPKWNDLSGMKDRHYDLVLAIGGDGTVAAVADYMVKNKVEISLGIVGLGSTNLLAVSFKIPTVNTMKAVEFAVKGQGKTIDVGLVNGEKVFLIAAGRGYDNVMMREASRELKRKIGFFAYVLGFFKTYYRYRRREFVVTIDGVKHKIDAKLVLILNFFRFGEDKFGYSFKPDDGVFEVLSLNPKGVLAYLKLFMFFLSRKKRHDHPVVKVFKGKKITVHSPKETTYQLDGDVYEGKDLEVELVRRGLKVVYSTSAR